MLVLMGMGVPMTCRAAIRKPVEIRREGQDTQLTELRTVLEDGKHQIARSQKLISAIEQRLESNARS